jgi:CBS domain containing-hemolysin-like protein
MNDDAGLKSFVSLLLVLASAFFVAAEYSLVGSRRSRIDTLARRGNRNAKALSRALDDIAPYVAGTQIAITLLSIGIGSYTEPFVTHLLERSFGQINQAVRTGVSLLLVTFVLVVIGELCPKYLTLRHAEKVALSTFRPLTAITVLLKPLIWLAQNTSRLLLKPFGVDLSAQESEAVPKEELLMLVQTGGAEGILDKTHAEMVTRALRLDVLSARDIMIHRLDIRWLDLNQPWPTTLRRLKEIPFTRLPVCRGDIDDMVGIAYLHDIVKHMDQPAFSLEKIVRPLVAIPENLPMEKIVQTMRDEKTQMLVVMDEYGGTSGLVTLEDVVEEVFGELEDRLESERKPIEIDGQRVSARADVRFDELVNRLQLNIDPDDNTDTLAQMMVDALERVPRPGDFVQTSLGIMRVENMARRRITRVSLNLDPALLASDSDVE